MDLSNFNHWYFSLYPFAYFILLAHLLRWEKFNYKHFNFYIESKETFNNIFYKIGNDNSLKFSAENLIYKIIILIFVNVLYPLIIPAIGWYFIAKVILKIIVTGDEKENIIRQELPQSSNLISKNEIYNSDELSILKKLQIPSLYISDNRYKLILKKYTTLLIDADKNFSNELYANKKFKEILDLLHIEIKDHTKLLEKKRNESLNETIDIIKVTAEKLKRYDYEDKKK